MHETDLGLPGDLDGFPARTLKGGTPIFRLHHAELGPFWFSSFTDGPAQGGNRFDLPHPEGTSYWALKPAAAFLETIARRPVSVIPMEMLDRYQLTTARLPHDLTAANAPVQRARGFGLTAEFFTTPNYPTTRRWATALRRAGFDALLSIPRHDVTAKLRCLSLFGGGGEHPPFGWAWDTTTEPIPASVVDEMHHWGIRCLPIPFDVETMSPD